MFAFFRGLGVMIRRLEGETQAKNVGIEPIVAEPCRQRARRSE
jgi:hypothetical protein